MVDWGRDCRGNGRLAGGCPRRHPRAGASASCMGSGSLRHFASRLLGARMNRDTAVSCAGSSVPAAFRDKAGSSGGSRLSRGCAGLPRSRRAGTLRPWPRCACAASAPRGRGPRPRSSAAPRTWTRPHPACRRQTRRTCVRADVRIGAGRRLRPLLTVPAAPVRGPFFRPPFFRCASPLPSRPYAKQAPDYFVIIILFGFILSNIH